MTRIYHNDSSSSSLIKWWKQTRNLLWSKESSNFSWYKRKNTDSWLTFRLKVCNLHTKDQTDNSSSLSDHDSWVTYFDTNNSVTLQWNKNKYRTTHLLAFFPVHTLYTNTARNFWCRFCSQNCLQCCALVRVLLGLVHWKPLFEPWADTTIHVR